MIFNEYRINIMLCDNSRCEMLTTSPIATFSRSNFYARKSELAGFLNFQDLSRIKSSPRTPPATPPPHGEELIQLKSSAQCKVPKPRLILLPQFGGNFFPRKLLYCRMKMIPWDPNIQFLLSALNVDSKAQRFSIVQIDNF